MSNKAVNIKVKDSEALDILKKHEAFLKADVGLLKGKASVEVIAYGILNELGGVNDNGKLVPSRPFIRRSIDWSNAKLFEAISDYINTCLEGNVDDAKDQLKADLIAIVRHSIVYAGEWAVPLSPMTIMHKHTNLPLIDTGAMLNSVSARTD